MNNLRIIIYMAFLLGMPFFTYSQTYEVQGTIIDSINNPVSNAIIIVSDSKNETNILAFKNSDDNGNYNLILKNEFALDSLWLIVKHISYETIRLKMQFISAKKDFKLYTRIEPLDEVFVISRRIVEVKGDTITYNVEGIKSDKDYTIEEVIKRIPGVTVSENGQIKYQDKPISHLYINDIDLLEGKYNIATRGIPADAVKEIDVMKNHNHDRIDIGRTTNDAVALNLKIKKDVNLLFGSIQGDGGIPLITGQLDATPIYLKNKFQNIGSFKVNNSGKSLRDIGTNLTSGNLNLTVLSMDETRVIKEPNINGVVLSDKYWLDNESFAITEDALHKINDTTLLKWNVNYVNEFNEIENKSSTVFLNNDQSSTVINQSRNQLKSQRFKSSVIQEINKRNFYLKNITNYRYVDNTGIESIILNENAIETKYSHSDFQVSNSTLVKTLVGNDNIIQAGIIAEYEQNSEELSVLPPVFESSFNSNTINDVTLQNVSVNKLNLGGFTQYAFKWLNLDWNLNQNISYNNFKFESSLKQIPGYTEQNFPFSSNFDFQKFSTTTKINSKFDVGGVKFTSGVSADFIGLIAKENKDVSIAINDSYLFIQPYLSLLYKINSKWSAGASYTLNTTISDYSQLYTPLILTNFNLLVQNPNFVNKLTTNSFTPYFNYSNILRSFFFSVTGNWNQSSSDVTFSNQLSNEGFIVTEVIEQPNFINNYGVTSNLTKGFLGSFKTDITYSYNYMQNKLFFNNKPIDAINNQHRINFDLSWDRGSWFTLEYKTRLNFGTSRISNNLIKNSILFQSLAIDFYTSSSTRLQFGFDSARTTTSVSNNIDTNTLFNSSFFYKPSKKINLNVSLLNVFDTPFFSTINSISNFVNVYQFSLRQRQLTFGFTYSL